MHVHEHVRVRLAVEQPLAREHLVQHDAERPDVRTLVDGSALGLLGTHVRRRPHHEAGLGVLAAELRQRTAAGPVPCAASNALASPKSSTLTLPSAVNLTLAGLRSLWTMPLTCAASSASAICPAILRASGAGIGPAHQAVGERRPFDQLEHQAGDAVGVLQTVDRRDVRVVERRPAAPLLARSAPADPAVPRTAREGS